MIERMKRPCLEGPITIKCGKHKTALARNGSQRVTRWADCSTMMTLTKKKE